MAAAYAKNVGKARPLVTLDTPIYAIKVPAYHASSWRDVILELDWRKFWCGPYEMFARAAFGRRATDSPPYLRSKKAFDSENHSILLSKTWTSRF